jgi:peptidyl-prolyl cis-trans isomerase C
MNFRSMLFVCPAVCLLAQTPPKPAQSGQSATPPISVTMTSNDTNAGMVATVPPETVVLTVGDVKLTAAQFDQLVSSLPPQVQASARGPNRKQFADNLVKVFVLSEEGKRRKLDETPAFKTQLQVQTANALASTTYDQIGKDAKIDEAEMRKYYEEHKGEGERVHARHILVRVQGAPMPVRPGQKELTDAEALAKVQELQKKIAGGASFETLAREDSDDATSGMNGGDLGFFGHNQMVPPFEKAAFALKPGELSEPVKSQFGYHLIKVEAKEAKTFEEMRPEIEKKLRPEAAQKALDALQKATKVEYDATFFAPPASTVNIPSPQPGIAK